MAAHPNTINRLEIPVAAFGRSKGFCEAVRASVVQAVSIR